MVVIIIYCFIIPLFFTLVVLEYHDEDWDGTTWISAFLSSVFWLPFIIVALIYWLHFKIKSNDEKRNKKSR